MVDFDIPTPAALIDLDRLESNIERMAQKAERFGVALRPHIKTHKCIEIGKMQQQAGATGITVSTLTEAYAFAEAGFKDITYAVPITPNKIKPALALGAKINLNLLADHASTIDVLESYAANLGVTANVMLKVDCGYHRCGVDPTSRDALHLAQSIVESDVLKFNGILTHAGHSYNASTPNQVREIAKQEQEPYTYPFDDYDTLPDVIRTMEKEDSAKQEEVMKYSHEHYIWEAQKDALYQAYETALSM